MPNQLQSTLPKIMEGGSQGWGFPSLWSSNLQAGKKHLVFSLTCKSIFIINVEWVCVCSILAVYKCSFKNSQMYQSGLCDVVLKARSGKKAEDKCEALQCPSNLVLKVEGRIVWLATVPAEDWTWIKARLPPGVFHRGAVCTFHPWLSWELKGPNVPLFRDSKQFRWNVYHFQIFKRFLLNGLISIIE